jgi:hypothetical protein
MNRIFILAAFSFLLPVANAELMVSPSSVNFYNQQVGSYGASANISVYNMGQQAVQVNVSSGCFSSFSVDNFCNLSLGPSGSCSLDVRFSPMSEGYQSCSIMISDNMGSSQMIDISGQGVRRP